MPKPQKLLALDLASSIGWSARWHSGKVSWGTHRLPKTGDDIGRFLRAYAEFFRSLAVMFEPEAVIFEAPIISSGKTGVVTARKLMCLAGRTEELCLEHDIPTCWEVNNMTVRKAFCGPTPRRDFKRRVVEMARQYGFECQTDDEADALAVLDYAMHCWGIGSISGSGPLFAGKEAAE